MTYSQIAFMLVCVGWPAFWVLIVVGIYQHWWVGFFQRAWRAMDRRDMQREMRRRLQQ